ncbi:MAG: SGNH/GDSL hydrolase family protein [Planctomycetota bacterium]
MEPQGANDRSRARRRASLAALSTVLSVAVAAPIVRSRLRPEDAGTVRVVDTRKEVDQLLRDRRIGAPDGDGRAPLEIHPLDRDAAIAFYPALEKKASPYDDLSAFGSWPFSSHVLPFPEHPEGEIHVRSNDYGMWQDANVREDDPPLRILFLGDSHAAGVVSNSESFATVAGELLSATRPPRTVETLNAAVGGYDTFNELGRLKRLAHLQPEIVVVIMYGGNDFYRLAHLERYFRGRGPAQRSARRTIEQNKAWGSIGSMKAQEFQQVDYYRNSPDDVSPTVEIAAEITSQMAEVCEEIGAELVLAYLPPPLTVQPRFFEDEKATAQFASDATDEDIAISDRIADLVLADAEARGIRTHDLRPAFHASEEQLYWSYDKHINIRGHRLLGEELHALIDEMSRSMTLAPVDEQGAANDDALFAALALPDTLGERWRALDGALSIMPIAGAPTIRFEASTDVATLEAPLPAGAGPPLRVRLGITSDGAFEVRVRHGARTSDVARGGNTRRQEISYDLDLGDAVGVGDAENAALLVDVLECSSPILVRSISIR